MARYKDIPAPDGYQHCPCCRETKRQSDFERTDQRACGFRQRCHVCLKEYREGLQTMRSINDGSLFSPVTATAPPAPLAALLASDIPLDDLG